jgi:hypothetical protein
VLQQAYVLYCKVLQVEGLGGCLNLLRKATLAHRCCIWSPYMQLVSPLYSLSSATCKTIGALVTGRANSSRSNSSSNSLT